MNESAGNEMRPRPHRVEQVKRETHDTFTLRLLSTNGTHTYEFAPGQFNMLYQFGVGESAISISGDPGKNDGFVHTIRAVGPVTQAMEKLKARSLVGVRGPYGRGWPMEESMGSDILLVAGGIGLAPLRPAMCYILSHREHYGRVVLLYGTRTPSDLLFRNELERWRARLDIEVDVTVDRAPREWRGNVGVVTKLMAKVHFDPFSSVAFVCGPEIMMRFTALDLQKSGMRPEDIYISMERNMKCGIGLCGHCQFGPTFVCKDGPVFRYDKVRELLATREI